MACGWQGPCQGSVAVGVACAPPDPWAWLADNDLRWPVGHHVMMTVVVAPCVPDGRLRLCFICCLLARVCGACCWAWGQRGALATWGCCRP